MDGWINILFVVVFFVVISEASKNERVTPSVRLNLGSALEEGNIKEGDDVYFECEFQANPRIHKVEWKHNGSPLLAERGIIIIQHVLILQSVNRMSAGLYTCNATNSEGTGNSNSVILGVTLPPEVSWHITTSHVQSNLSPTEPPLQGVNKTASDDFVVGNIQKFWTFAPASSRGPNGRFDPGIKIHFSELFHTTGNGSECCRECNNFPVPFGNLASMSSDDPRSNSMINFYQFTSPEETKKYCSCSNQFSDLDTYKASPNNFHSDKFPTQEKLRKLKGHYFTELCDSSIEISGGVGVDRPFIADSVQYLGWAPVYWSEPMINSIRRAEGECCQRCKNWYSAKMVEYDRGGSQGRCKCIDVKPGKTPTTRKAHWFADMC